MFKNNRVFVGVFAVVFLSFAPHMGAFKDIVGTILRVKQTIFGEKNILASVVVNNDDLFEGHGSSSSTLSSLNSSGSSDQNNNDDNDDKKVKVKKVKTKN